MSGLASDVAIAATAEQAAAGDEPAFARIVATDRAEIVHVAYAVSAGSSSRADETACEREEVLMLRFLRVSIVVAALLAMSASPALASAPPVPIKGTLLGGGAPDMAAPGCAPGAIWRFNGGGTGQMSHLGEVDYEFTHCTYPDFTNSPGTFTLVAANGDELVLVHVGAYAVIGNMEGFTGGGTWTAVGGTGRFANATGSGSWETVGDVPGGDALFGLPDGYMRFTFQGMVAYDASDRSS